MSWLAKESTTGGKIGIGWKTRTNTEIGQVNFVKRTNVESVRTTSAFEAVLGSPEVKENLKGTLSSHQIER